jgi:hypothetical protein
MDDAVRICVERNWVALNASWLKPEEKAKPQGRHSGFGSKNYREGVSNDGSLA